MISNLEKVTITFITESLENCGYDDVKIKDIKIEKLTGGFLGEVLRVKIEYESDDEEKNDQELPNSVVCKFHPTRFFQNKLHVRETMFFKEFSNEEEFPFFPKYYHSKLELETGEGVIVMEDVNDMDVYPFEIGLDVIKTKIMFDSMAKFHARFWNQKDFVSKIFDQYGLKIVENGEKLLLKNLFQKYVSNEEKMKEFSEEVQKNMKLCSANISAIMKNIYKVHQTRSVTHSDLWNNNVLFPLSPSSGSRQIKILDFQFCDYSLPQEDLVFLLYSSLETNFLKTNEKELVEYYYERLVQYLKIFHENRIIYSKEECFSDLEACRIYGVIFTLASEEIFNEKTRNRLLYALNSFFTDEKFQPFLKNHIL